MARLQGKIEWFDEVKGFGLIKYDENEVFVHHSSIKTKSSNYKILDPEEEIEFELGTDKNGRQCAQNVTGWEGKQLKFELSSNNNPKKKTKKHNKFKNTQNFEPSHTAADANILIGNPKKKTYDRTFGSNDIALVSGLFDDEGDVYQKLLDEINSVGLENEDLWKLWHGDSHFIADDHLEWKEACPTFNMVIDKISRYFNMQPKSTRLNWYENSDHWKPFHHDAAAIKPHIAKKQNITVGVSFGAERDIAFEHSETKAVISFPLEDGTIYAFGNDVNSGWKHGIPQLAPEKSNNDGRISIIAWGWSESQAEEKNKVLLA